MPVRETPKANHFYEKIHFCCDSLATVLFRGMQSLNKCAIRQSRSVHRNHYGIAESSACGSTGRYYNRNLEYGRRQRRASLRLTEWRSRSGFRRWHIGICRSTMDLGGDNIRVSSLRWNRTHQDARQDPGDGSEIKGGLPVAINRERPCSKPFRC